MSLFVGKQHPPEQFEHKISICHFINFLNDIIYHNLNQHSSINILGVPSKSLILKVLPIKVDGLIDIGGLASLIFGMNFMALVSYLFLIICKVHNPESYQLLILQYRAFIQIQGQVNSLHQ